jgi:hypothetical protein
MNYPDYQLNLLEVEPKYIQNTSSKRFWYNHIKKNALKNDGDIFEFGVYRGTSLITAALILKQLKSKKKIFGFDSFCGFPSVSSYDEFSNFNNKLYFKNKFREQLKKFYKFKKDFSKVKKFTPSSVGTSGNFSKTSYQYVINKLQYFKLKNVELIKGDFKKTIPQFFKNNEKNISSCHLDSDLYEGYNIALPYVYKNLSKGGYIFLDEYFSFNYPGARIATDDFCKQNNLRPKKHKTRKGEFERWYIKR